MERFLPQNIEAEASVLGSLLIDPEAISLVIDFLRADDFYRDGHRTLYEVITQLYERHEPADFVILCHELARQSKLDEVGGESYIASLVSLVPTSGNIEYYGRIVERLATLRRLIHVGGQIVAAAYAEDDAEAVLEQSEQMIFSVRQERTQNRSQTAHIRDAITSYMDRLDSLYMRRSGLIGTPTGFSDLDRLLGGLQRSDLIILAARPAVGKTSFALSLAYNAAVRYQCKIGIFSLEMSIDQLVQRLISMEAGVDQQRLRSGRVEDDEWDHVVRAANVFSAVTILLDETASLTTSQLRSKARQWIAEANGLDLIIVDYLQLMASEASGGRSDNRVQVIDEISRQLKVLARELNVPILALAQLSRAVETRQSKVPQLSDLRESGCLTGDTLVYLPDEGYYRRIDSLVGQQGFHVLALNTGTWKFEPRPVTHAFSTGRKQVFRLKTRSGRTIRATANHRFLTFDGWRRLDELQPEMHLALPRALPSPETPVAMSEVYWDEVVAIEPDGEEEVYDFTVDGLHNFVANNIVVHNSLEQNADIVMFIYRDEVYNPETERKGLADIIVAKHRNGPTGEVCLYFNRSQTRFQDMIQEQNVPNPFLDDDDDDDRYMG
ncbi:replicative DNA helicase [Reticulibacter mediterranei]|uniref:Replicative DNA helicase n=1 Tax=Reticulibacter mediterranei TaxID=2778369 RepID=A0A8J3IZG4_9CHLR|nr:replicative DNA helicase [Reticulibacter mediterranei]GHO98076.1 replicative DNA helicase [Reticulibacter mediterranei]